MNRGGGTWTDRQLLDRIHRWMGVARNPERERETERER